jgi:hypothetical protein
VGETKLTILLKPENHVFLNKNAILRAIHSNNFLTIGRRFKSVNCHHCCPKQFHFLSFPRSLSPQVVSGEQESRRRPCKSREPIKELDSRFHGKPWIPCQARNDRITKVYNFFHNLTFLNPYRSNALLRNFIILHPMISAAVPYFCHSGLSRIFLVIPNKSKGFPTSGNDTENKYSISDALRSLPQGIHSFQKEG